MKKKNACRLAARFIEAVANLEQLVKIERPYPTIVFQDRTPGVDKTTAFAAENCETVSYTLIAINSNRQCVINSYLPDPDDDQFYEKALCAAGEYLAIDFIEKFTNVAWKYIAHHDYPFEFVSEQQVVDLLFIRQTDPLQIGKGLIRHTASPVGVCASFFRDYAYTLMELLGKVPVSHVVKESIQYLTDIFATPKTEFERCLEIATILGWGAAFLYGPEGFGAGLKVRPEEFHGYLNRVYRDLKNKAFELHLD